MSERPNDIEHPNVLPGKDAVSLVLARIDCYKCGGNMIYTELHNRMTCCTSVMKFKASLPGKKLFGNAILMEAYTDVLVLIG